MAGKPPCASEGGVVMEKPSCASENGRDMSGGGGRGEGGVVVHFTLLGQSLVAVATATASRGRAWAGLSVLVQCHALWILGIAASHQARHHLLGSHL